MTRIVYNINRIVINKLSKFNNKLETKYGFVPLSFEEVATNLNLRGI